MTTGQKVTVAKGNASSSCPEGGIGNVVAWGGQAAFYAYAVVIFNDGRVGAITVDRMVVIVS